MAASTVRVTIDRLLAAESDVGYCEPPGGGQSEKVCRLYALRNLLLGYIKNRMPASEKVCRLYALRNGRWEAEGEVKTGGNQGYFQVDYEYGPWRGRGDSPAEAVHDMIDRADSEWQDAMRKAGHDAILECEGESFGSLAAAEASRIRAVLAGGKTHEVVRIGVHRYRGLDRDAQTNLRQRAVAVLQRLAKKDHPQIDLSQVPDDLLLAEAKSRGLV